MSFRITDCNRWFVRLSVPCIPLLGTQTQKTSTVKGQGHDVNISYTTQMRWSIAVSLGKCAKFHAVTLYGRCCRRHVVGQQVVSDVSSSCWSICSLCSESNNTNLPLRLLIDVLGTCVLLYMPHTQHGGVYLVIENLVTPLHLIYCSKGRISWKPSEPHVHDISNRGLLQ